MLYAKGYLFRIPSNKWSSKKQVAAAMLTSQTVIPQPCL